MYQLLNEMCEDTLLSACVFEWHNIFSEEVEDDFVVQLTAKTEVNVEK
jgi:hypothetical protein